MPSRTDSPIAAIDRDRTLTFTFDGRTMTGHPGDTLASALLANDVAVVGRSPYLDRPRGLFSAGAEEPNAIVELDHGTHTQPLVRATAIELYDGLVARSLKGRGRIGSGVDPSRYDTRHRHCDVLVIGGGPAGVAAAEAAGATGARVILVEDQPELGGSLLHAAGAADAPAHAWLRTAGDRLERAAETTVLTRATTLGLYDDGYAVIAQRRTEHVGPDAPQDLARQRLWHVRARRIVLATGAIERPIVFAGNDRPGIMLADAARLYANRYAVAAGRRAIVFTNNDSAYDAAADLLARGIQVAALVDARPAPPATLVARLRDADVEVHVGAAVVGALGDERLTAVRVAALDADGAPAGPAQELPCDLLAVSGGWTPTLHLYAQAGGRLRYEPSVAAHVPDGEHPTVDVVGAAAGTAALADGLAAGGEAGRAAAAACGFAGPGLAPPVLEPRLAGSAIRPLWAVPPEAGEDWERHFVDLARDATVSHLHRAVGAGLRSLEHIKRYTSVGTGSDQGKTSNLNAMGIVAALLDRPLATFSPVTYRPPYTPVPFAVLAGRRRGALHDPARTTPVHAWHVAAGAEFEDVGQWKRAWFYPRDGEDMDAAVLRECAAVRERVGIMDASTLGKIDVQGPDAGEFLDRMYTNMMSTVPVGACRYGVVCGLDGMVFDDGVVMRIGDDRFVTTTTTGNAAAVMDWMEEWLQTEWPELQVRLTSVTDHWAAIAIAGPRARDVVAQLVDDVALDAEAFPFMKVCETTVAGAPARLCRVSFSGELAFEVHTPGRYGLAVWEAIMAAGEPHGITPYGTEAMHVLRAEKGYVIVGQDTDGTVTPHDAAMGWAVSKKKDFFVGRRSLRRPDLMRDDRLQLVGLLPEDPAVKLPEGAQVLLGDDGPARGAGHVTSSYVSGALGRTFAMALVRGGLRRSGETVTIPLDGRDVSATVTSTVFYDPEGHRRDGDPDEPA
jgi:sarcosine oxidase subunit alpha